MKHKFRDLLVSGIVLGGFSTNGNASQPPDAVQSDNSYSTAMGSSALIGNLKGAENTAAGSYALFTSQNDIDNTAFGSEALYANNGGSFNTAVGANTLSGVIAGNDNTAVGSYALSNINGSGNTAVGANALVNSNGSDGPANNNTALGVDVLGAATTGSSNTAIGYQSLYDDSSGSYNMAAGIEALYKNTTGGTNTALGRQALFSNTSGSNNIAFGNNAGYKLTTGSNNIDFGAEGNAGESGIIRIGTSGTQTAAFISGIESSKVTGAAVYVTSSGQLGVLASSERYKTAIAPMGTDTEKLQALRPVTFHLKSEPEGAVQYGLIAEEVAKVYPELVIRDAGGTVQGVRYDELAPMLLNKVQQQDAQLNQQTGQLSDQAAQLKLLQAQMADVRQMREQLAAAQAAILELHDRGERVAMR